MKKIHYVGSDKYSIDGDNLCDHKLDTLITKKVREHYFNNNNRLDNTCTTHNLIQSASSNNVRPTSPVHSGREVYHFSQGMNISTQLPKFKPGRETHPNQFIQVFSRTLPSNWPDSKKKNDFTLCYLVGEAAEWHAANVDEFTTWADFKSKFKEKYWSESTQQKLKFELSNPLPYD